MINCFKKISAMIIISANRCLCLLLLFLFVCCCCCFLWGGGGGKAGGHGDFCAYFEGSLLNCFKDIDDVVQLKTKL